MREREKERERDCGVEIAEGANKCKSFVGVRCVACRCMEEASCVCVCLCVCTHTHPCKGMPYTCMPLSLELV